MFEDILFGLVAAITLGLCVIARKVFLTLADIVGLWKISQAQMDDGMINEDDLPRIFSRSIARRIPIATPKARAGASSRWRI